MESSTHESADTEHNVNNVRKYHQILIWPLQLCGGEKANSISDQARCLLNTQLWQEEDLYHRDSTLKSTRYAEFVYFHPFVQRFLYGVDNHPECADLRLFKRADINQISVEYNVDQTPLTLLLDVKRIHLYLFSLDIAILVLEVSLGADTSGKCIAQIQDLLDQLRRVYPPFWRDDSSAGRCPIKVSWIDSDGNSLCASDYQDRSAFIDFVETYKRPPVASHWQYLLEPLKPFSSTSISPDKLFYKQLGDERIPFMAYLAVDNPSAISRGDFIRLCFADDSSRDSSEPYASDFLANFEQDYCYDRFWQDRGRHSWMNSRIMNCGYGFVMIGPYADNLESNEPGFYANEINGALANFRYHYFQMGLIVHFHKAALLMLSDRVADAMQYIEDTYTSPEPTASFNNRIKSIANQLLRFTHRFWFQELSNQVQAKELFALWSRHLGTEQAYQAVHNDVKELNDIIDLREQQEQTKVQQQQVDTTVRLTTMATIGLALALVAGIMGMNVFSDTIAAWLWFAFGLVVAGIFLSLPFTRTGKRIIRLLTPSTDQ